MSTWNTTTPANVSKIKISAALIRNHWVAIDNSVTGLGYGFSRNHITMADPTNGGLHYRVDFYQALSSPTLDGVASAYPRTVTNTEFFYKNPVQDIQITNSALSASSGEGMLPGGLLIKGGVGTLNVAVTFVTAFPTAVTSITLTPYGSGGDFRIITPPTLSQFTATGSGINFYWTAIGY